ncbi:uncharacterized protein LOC107266680 isoform X2 [Cephus cinctus]|uniref:Uncharacterized protein LOC107266680 isoform X2 n=1 Tax=Cephus cinctus TaxID=211228 RepID=A0AAJ7BSV4_CEPCN|nr:uncharacterized protein LOC107266680 isoform X2 [Cephus cinctus]
MKYRLVKKVTLPALRKMKQELEIEEKNMFYLRHPYLTVEQSIGHMHDLKENNQMTKFRQARLQKFCKTVTLADHLNHLKVKDAWE